ncbi:MAG: transaldolase [Thermomicrobiales bacterium]
MTNNTITQLLSEGQSVWLDDISRGLIKSGELKRRVEEIGIRGVTSNPTIFEKAISSGTDYDDSLMDLIEKGLPAAQIFEAVEVEDIRDACDVLRSTYDASDGRDGFISIEVSPGAARDAAATRDEVQRLWTSVDRPNLMVKIPGTSEGAPVIGEMLRKGININITLLFSIQNYERVALAFVSAVEQRVAAGEPVDRLASVASFFVSRVDTLVDKQLDAKIASASNDEEAATYRALQGRVAIANAKLAYAKFQEIFDSPRFAPLRAAGAQVQRPLWASTGTKNPAYSDVLYIDTLIGPDTVNTMPEKTLYAFLDHGKVRRTVDTDLDQARQVVADLAAAGMDLAAVTAQLEEEGITTFEKSFDALLAGVERKRSALKEAVAAT